MSIINTSIVPDETEELTLEQVTAALPKTLRSSASQALVDKINAAVSDPIEAQHIRDNFISYASVLKDGKFKTESYLNAVTYVTYKLMGYTNEEAYERTFPTQHAALVARGATRKDISSYVAAFHRGKLVNLIMEQTLVPVWILNQHIYQQAINTQVTLMTTANSEKVRSDAADSLLNHLKKPETKEINLNIGANESSGLKDLEATLVRFAEMQREAIANGQTTRQIAAQPIFEGEYTDVEDPETDSKT